MNNQKKITWQKHVIFIAQIALIFSVGAFSSMNALAQDENIQFGAVYDCPSSSVRNFKILNCGNNGWCEVFFANSSPEGGYKDEMRKSKIQELLATGTCTVNGQKATTQNKDGGTNKTGSTTNTGSANTGQTGQKPTGNQKNTGGQNRRFKVGERVLASPMAMSGDEYFEKCTVIKDYMETEGYDTYRVRCDDPKGGIGQEANVKVPYIRVWANATPAPTPPDCPFTEPAGTVSKTSRPSAELFKRVIFERYRDMSNGRKTGITYQTFQIGKTYVNRLTNNGLLYDGAPQGATIYQIKTNFIFCDRYDKTTIRTVYEAQYSCFKDRTGDWACTSDSTKNLDQVHLQNK